MTQHKERVSKELRYARVKGFALNVVFIFYTFFVIASLARHLFDWKFSFSSVLPISSLLSLVLGAAYSASRQSVGYVLVLYSNRLLKQNVQGLGFQAVRKFTKYYSITLFLLTLWLGFILTEASVVSLLSIEGLSGAKKIFLAIMDPEGNILAVVLEAMVQTIFIALIATLLSLPISFICGFLCARNLMMGNSLSASIYYVFRFVFNFIRSVEPLIWAIMLSVWVGIGPFAGMLALMLHSIASLAKNYSEQIECIDQGPLEAIEATGANRIQVVWYAVVPQIMLPFLAFTIYRWDINIRMATIIGLVGGGGIGSLLIQYSGLAKWNEVGTIILVIALVVWIMDYLSAKIREAIY